jgi:HlyD family secretion protein
MGAEPIFRKASLERMSSPEQLDVLLRVTSPKGWWALGALGLVLAAVVVWSIVGTITTTVDGQGVLVIPGELMMISTEQGGTLTQLHVQPGQEVHQGDLIVEIAQREVVERIDKLRSEHEELKQQDETLTKSGELSFTLQDKAIAGQRAALEKTLQTARQRRVDHQELVHKQRDLLRRRLITEQQMLAFQQGLDAINKEIGSAETSLLELIAQREKLRQSLDEAHLGRVFRIDDAKRRLELAEAELARNSRVYSPHAGRVVDIRTAAHSFVTPGTGLAELEPLGSYWQHLQVVTYVSAQEAKKIRLGNRVEVSPSTAKREKYGYIIGTVRAISVVPVASDTLYARLKNKDLAEQILKSLGGVVFELRVELDEDTSTYTHYRWSSSEGPDHHVSAGTLCTTRITVHSERPITLLIPYLKKTLGLD